MSDILPIDIQSLLYFRGVESSRVEFKASWDSEARDGTSAQVLKTICAFANDYQNLNGGYIIIGVEEQGGKAVLPPAGLADAEIEAAQKWIYGNCNRITPFYQPYMSPEKIEGRNILVIWAPGGDNRPYQAPDPNKQGAPHCFVRFGVSTIRAQGEMLSGLMQQAAKIPFDDRRATGVTIDRISMSLVRRHLLGRQKPPGGRKRRR